MGYIVCGLGADGMDRDEPCGALDVTRFGVNSFIRDITQGALAGLATLGFDMERL